MNSEEVFEKVKGIIVEQLGVAETAVTMDELKEKLQILKDACATDDDNTVREALRKVVPTFRKPEEVNCQV